jgi:hypothetical protein
LQLQGYGVNERAKPFARQHQHEFVSTESRGEAAGISRG